MPSHLGSTLVSTCVVVTSLLAVGHAQADASPRFDFSGFYFPFGANLGTALRSEGQSGLLLGSEVSGLYYWDNDAFTFLGGYTDYTYDFGAGAHRVSFGPELGSYFCGIDAGPALELKGGSTEVGWRARVFGSLAFVSLYVGEWYRPAPRGALWSTEIGLLLKLPTLNHSESQGWTFDVD